LVLTLCIKVETRDVEISDVRSPGGFLFERERGGRREAFITGAVDLLRWAGCFLRSVWRRRRRRRRRRREQARLGAAWSGAIRVVHEGPRLTACPGGREKLDELFSRFSASNVRFGT